MLALNKIYEILVLLMFLYSVYLGVKGEAKLKFYFYIYISTVLVVDIFFIKIRQKFLINSNYVFFVFIIISYIYFYFFFLKHFRKNLYKTVWTIVFFIFLFLTLMFQIRNNFSELSSITIVLLPLFYIFGSMGWFAYLLNENVVGQIFDKMAFWISSGLLIWGAFFIFRGLPMYYFNNTDPIFLNEISNVFTVINIITYSLFFRSLFCRQ